MVQALKEANNWPHDSWCHTGTKDEPDPKNCERCKWDETQEKRFAEFKKG